MLELIMSRARTKGITTKLHKPHNVLELSGLGWNKGDDAGSKFGMTPQQCTCFLDMLSKFTKFTYTCQRPWKKSSRLVIRDCFLHQKKSNLMISLALCFRGVNCKCRTQKVYGALILGGQGFTVLALRFGELITSAIVISIIYPDAALVWGVLNASAGINQP